MREKVKDKKQVEIIGEAVYMLTKEFRSSHPQVDWDTIELDIPLLKPFIEEFYKECE